VSGNISAKCAIGYYQNIVILINNYNNILNWSCFNKTNGMVGNSPFY